MAKKKKRKKVKRPSITIRFYEGFTYDGQDYGWYNGELYLLKGAYMREGEILKLSLRKERKTMPPYYLLGAKRADKHDRFTVAELIEMTHFIDFKYVDRLRLPAAYAPANNREADGFGLDAGVRWKGRDKLEIRRYARKPKDDDHSQ